MKIKTNIRAGLGTRGTGGCGGILRPPPKHPPVLAM
jgi:hypothetical protein